METTLSETVRLGQEVSIKKETGVGTTWVSGVITGVSLNDNGKLRSLEFAGLGTSFWIKGAGNPIGDWDLATIDGKTVILLED